MADRTDGERITDLEKAHDAGVADGVAWGPLVDRLDLLTKEVRALGPLLSRVPAVEDSVVQQREVSTRARHRFTAYAALLALVFVGYVVVDRTSRQATCESRNAAFEAQSNVVRSIPTEVLPPQTRNAVADFLDRAQPLDCSLVPTFLR